MNTEKSGEIDVEGWIRGLMDVHARIAKHFERAEPRQHVLAYLRVCLKCDIKPVWQMHRIITNFAPLKAHPFSERRSRYR